jgi:hypothetical protein
MLINSPMARDNLGTIEPFRQARSKFNFGRRSHVRFCDADLRKGSTEFALREFATTKPSGTIPDVIGGENTFIGHHSESCRSVS